MSEHTLFSIITLNSKPLKDCELVLSCNQGNYRLYVDRDASTNSFYAMAVEYVSGGFNSGDDFWRDPGVEVQQLFKVTAYFDGVRHLEFNRSSDMPGYLYYPDMEGLILMMQKVREIEKQICWDCEGFTGMKNEHEAAIHLEQQPNNSTDRTA